MKLNKDQLRSLINEEVEIIESGRLDENLEQWFTTALGQAGVGDVAAGVKAFTLDAGRLVTRLSDLYATLEPFGEFDMGLDDSEEFDMLLANISMAPDEAKQAIKDSVYSIGDIMKTFLVSLISASPDAVISTPVAAAISALPVENIFLEGTRLYADFIEKVESLPGGSGLTWFAELTAKGSQLFGMGPLAFFFADPLTMLKNLGRMMEAASGKSVVGDTIMFASDIAKSPEMLAALGDTGGIQLPALTESRLTKLAGLK